MLLGCSSSPSSSRRPARREDDEITFEEAEEIARDEVDFEPETVLVRGVQRGLDAHLYWAVSLSTTTAAGIREDCATVLVDSETGETETEPC